MNRGVPPTALKARTGEFTPPGMAAHAREKSSAETVSTPSVWQSSPACRVPGVHTRAEEDRDRSQDQDEEPARERDRVNGTAADHQRSQQQEHETHGEDGDGDAGPVAAREREEAEHQVEQRD